MTHFLAPWDDDAEIDAAERLAACPKCGLCGQRREGEFASVYECGDDAAPTLVCEACCSEAAWAIAAVGRMGGARRRAA